MQAIYVVFEQKIYKSEMDETSTSDQQKKSTYCCNE